jgi:universal stress protein A
MKTQTVPRPVDPPELRLGKILVPLDFSPLSKRALKYALRLARQFKAELILFHAVEPTITPTLAGLPERPLFSESKLATAEKKLRALVASARTAGITRSGSTVRIGIASHEIVETAKDLDADLIVIGTHGFTGWKHFCIGSTAERVVRAASCTVLVVREKEHQFA